MKVLSTTLSCLGLGLLAVLTAGGLYAEAHRAPDQP
jgi:hypothetical protein